MTEEALKNLLHRHGRQILEEEEEDADSRADDSASGRDSANSRAQWHFSFSLQDFN